MSLRITVLPASTQAGKATIKTLLKDERAPSIRAIYRNLSKAPSEFVNHARFEAVQGDVSGDSELDLSDSDAVFYIPPPTYDGTDSAEFARKAAGKVKAAVEKASSVKRLLVFSAMGSQHDKGIVSLHPHSMCSAFDFELTEAGHPKNQPHHRLYPPNQRSGSRDLETRLLHGKLGQRLRNTQSRSTIFRILHHTPRPQSHNGTTTSHHHLQLPELNTDTLPQISLQDIAQISTTHLLSTNSNPLPSTPHMLTLHGPRNYSPEDVRAALVSITAQSNIRIHPIYPDQLHDFFGKDVPDPYAQELMEMTTASLPGGVLMGDMENGEGEGVVRGGVELVESLGSIFRGADGQSG